MERINTPHGQFYRLLKKVGDNDDDSGENYQEVVYPSCTDVLSVYLSELIPWSLRECTSYLRRNTPPGRLLTRECLDDLLLAAMQQPQRRLDEACSFDSEARRHLVRYLSTGCLPSLGRLEPRLRSWVETAVAWWETQGLVCLSTEQGLGSHTYRTAGALDCLAARGRDLFVINFKSSDTPAAAIPQLIEGVFYKTALAETWDSLLPACPWNDFAEAHVLVVRIAKEDAAVEVLHCPPEEHPRLLAAFCACRTLFDLQMKGEGLVREARAFYRTRQQPTRPSTGGDRE